LKITAEVLPYEKMRYETAGDYFMKPDGSWVFQVADTGNEASNIMILIHELVEWFLTQQKGITEESITAFDEKFEEERERGLHGEDDEPGDALDAPYRDEHCIATAVERILCGHLGIPWQKYDEDVMSLWSDK
jgi:hypothetical protein